MAKLLASQEGLTVTEFLNRVLENTIQPLFLEYINQEAQKLARKEDR